MAAEWLIKVNNRFHGALNFHRDAADLFWFLSLPGFAMLHEYQLAVEALCQRKLKKFITEVTGMLVVDGLPIRAGMSEIVKGKIRTKIEPTFRWNMLKKSWEAYEEWERETLAEYEVIAKELSNDGYLVEYSYILKIVNEVNEELNHLRGILIEMSGMDWDISTISDMQEAMQEKYEYKLREMHKRHKKYHHFNSIE